MIVGWPKQTTAGRHVVPAESRGRGQRHARRELFAELLADTPDAELATVASLLHRLADRLEALAG